MQFLAYTGVRFGEMAALCVRNLDLLRRRAAITRSVAEVRGRAVFSTPKTHQSRSVPIPRFLVDDLAAHIAGKAPEDFVFSAPRGGVLRLRNFRRAGFEPAVKIAGLDGMTPHALRHTVTRHRGRRERHGGAGNARPHVGDDDPRSVRPPIRKASSSKWPTRWTRRELPRTLAD